MSTTRPGLRRDLALIFEESWRKRPGRVLVISGLNVATALTEGLSLMMLVPILKSLQNDGTVSGEIFGQTMTVGLGMVLLVFILLVTARVVFQWFTAVTTSRLSMEMVDELRVNALEALLLARWSFFLQRNNGHVLHTINADADRAGFAVDRASAMLGTIATLIALVTIAFVTAPYLAIVALIVTVLAVAISLPIIRRSHGIGQRVGDQGRTLMGGTVNALDSMRLIRAHGAGPDWLRSLRTSTTNLRHTMISVVKRAGATTAVVQVASVTGAALLIYIGWKAGVDAAKLLLFVLVFSRMLSNANRVTRDMQLLASNAPAVAAILDLTQEARDAEEPSNRTDPDAPAPGSGPPALALRSVTYTYPTGSEPAITDLTMEIPAGSITALAGPSGAGKSTAVDLFLGLLHPDTGRVTADGRALADLDLDRWRTRTAYVPQDPNLIDASLRENLVLGLPQTVLGTDDACWKALARAGAEFAHRLPDGLDTMLGGRGVRLSGGERQRVALARALIRQPKLLVLDEATSALDDATESIVHREILRLRGSCTVLIVAHRQSSLAIADRVFTLERGRMIGEGAPTVT